MNQINTYHVCFEIVINHSYFDGAECGLILEPNTITNRLLQKAGIIFKQQNTCTWLLIANEEINLDSEMNLCFLLKTKNENFEYFTDQTITNSDSWSLVGHNKSGTWKLLNIILTKERLIAKESETIEIKINSLSKHLEYLIFPSLTFSMNQLEIREQQGKITFDKPQVLKLPETDKKVYRFVSKEAIPLKNKNTYQFYLWKIGNSSEIQLLKLPDFPQVQSLSPFSPKDTLTNYIYL